MQRILYCVATIRSKKMPPPGLCGAKCWNYSVFVHITGHDYLLSKETSINRLDLWIWTSYTASCEFHGLIHEKKGTSVHIAIITTQHIIEPTPDKLLSGFSNDILDDVKKVKKGECKCKNLLTAIKIWLFSIKTVSKQAAILLLQKVGDAIMKQTTYVCYNHLKLLALKLEMKTQLKSNKVTQQIQYMYDSNGFPVWARGNWIGRIYRRQPWQERRWNISAKVTTFINYWPAFLKTETDNARFIFATIHFYLSGGRICLYSTLHLSFSMRYSSFFWVGEAFYWCFSGWNWTNRVGVKYWFGKTYVFEKTKGCTPFIFSRLLSTYLPSSTFCRNISLQSKNGVQYPLDWMVHPSNMETERSLTSWASRWRPLPMCWGPEDLLWWHNNSENRRSSRKSPPILRYTGTAVVPAPCWSH